MSTASVPRLGALRYLNARPLVEGLERDTSVAVSYEIPSLLAEDLHQGNLDLALVPLVEACRGLDYAVVEGLCIACDGPVESILLFRRGPWESVRRIGVDLSSRSSVELLKVLWQRRIGQPPELVRVPPRLDPLHSASSVEGLDAVLLIGDRALAEASSPFERDDLGALWKDLTGLPFVFAVWAGRDPLPAAAVDAVQRAARQGLARRAQLAEAFCREHPEVIEPARAQRYLETSIRYHLGAPELAGIERFLAWRVAAGLAPTHLRMPPLMGAAGART